MAAEIGDIPDAARIFDEMTMRAEQELEDWRKIAAASVPGAQAHSLGGRRAWDSVSAFAERFGADLLVIGAGTRRHGLLGSTAERILRHAASSVLVAAGPARPAKRILCAVDFSRQAREAVAAAAALAAEREAQLTLVHVFSYSETAVASMPRAARYLVDKKKIEGRIAELRRQIADKTTSSYDKEKLEERLAKLSGGVAVIRVGAASESELKSRKEAFDDAIHATRAALEEGMVPGGGLAFLRAIDALGPLEAELDGDERTGVRLLKRALETPARQIAENSGADDGVVVDKMRSGTGAFGFDAARGTYCDLVAAGIIDPTKVVRTALENAVSVAGILLLTEATLTEIPEPRSDVTQPPPDLA